MPDTFLPFKVIRDHLDCELVHWFCNHHMMRCDLRWPCCGYAKGHTLFTVRLWNGDKVLAVYAEVAVRPDGALVSIPKDDRSHRFEMVNGGLDAVVNVLERFGYGKYAIGGL